MMPFKITMDLISPIILTHHLHLDAILARALYDDTDDLVVAHEKLPLKRTGNVWHASALRLSQPCILTNVSFSGGLRGEADLDTDLFKPKSKKYTFIDTARGEYKASLNVYQAYECRDQDKIGKAYFYGVGDIEEVTSLFTSYIFGLGKKQQTGYGCFENFQIQEVEEDYSIIHPIMGVMRAVPSGTPNLPDDHITALSPCSPPYYQENRELCSVPSSVLHCMINEPAQTHEYF